MSSPNVYLCKLCDVTFSSRQRQWEHNKNYHPEIIASKSRQPSLKCGICSNLFLSQLDLCRHVSDDHSKPAVVQEAHFDSAKAFKSWKEAEESKRKCSFSSSKNSKTKSGVRTEYYFCHRSGTFTPEGDKIRAPRVNVTNRIGFQCSAFITAKIQTDDSIDITYCLNHYGHDHLINRIPLSQSIRVKVKDQLLDGRSFDTILKNAHQNFKSADGLERDQLLKRSDIFNIQRKYGLRPHQKHDKDMESVKIWVEEHKNSEDNPFLCFQPLKDDNGKFILGIQTNFQKEMLLRFAESAICMDATHGTTQWKGYLLVTVLVVADQGKGFPAAWFVISQETEEILVQCLLALRKRVGQLRTKFFMTDDANQYWNAWRAVFNDVDEPRKLLCSWHIKKNWEAQMKIKAPADYHDDIRSRLNELLNTADNGKFRVLLTSFRSALRQIAECKPFLDYFDRYYCGNPFRMQEWALWARRESVVNTNMFLEAFHDKLKHRFLGGKQNRRMDALIYQLLEDVQQHYLQDYVLVQQCGLPANAYRMQCLTQRHKSSGKLAKEKVVRLDDDDCWLVPSESTAGRFYRVQRRINGVDCTCLLKCRFCKICPDMYVCNCDDAVMPTTACKHMHLVHEMVNGDVYTNLAQSEVVEDQLPNQTDADIDSIRSTEEMRLTDNDFSEQADEGRRSPDPVSHLRRYSTAKKAESNLTKEVVVDAIKSMLHEIEMGTGDLSTATLAALMSKTKEMTALGRSSSTIENFVPMISEDAGPANKKSKRQRRF